MARRGRLRVRPATVAAGLAAATWASAAPGARERATPSGPRVHHHALEVGGGLRADAVRDDLIVPLAFAGPGLRSQVGYRGDLGPGRLTARGDFGLAFLWNRYGHLAATFDYGLATTWTVPARDTPSLRIALGPAIALDSRVTYFDSWDDAHGYWLGAQWLGPAAELATRLGARWRLDATAALGLAGFVGRPPTYRFHKQDALTHPSFFFTEPHRDETPAGIAQLQALRLRADARPQPYRRDDVGTRWSLGTELRLTRTPDPRLNVNLSADLHAVYSWGL